MKKWILAVLTVLLMQAMLFASTAGKITGHIVREDTGEPLMGVNVFLQETFIGATTDETGYYVILNVPAGEHTMIATYIGYSMVTVQKVKVSIDLTTTIDIKMKPQVLESSESVIVTAERPLLKRDEFTSRHNVTSEEMDIQPVDGFEAVAMNQAGVVGSHFRGGRSNEVLVVIDGIPVRDPAGAYAGSMGGFSANVPEGGIQELEVSLGGFSAEYGNVQSGVLNLAMKEGAQKYSGRFRAITSNFGDGLNAALMGERDEWLDVKYQHLKKNIYQFNLSGPEPISKLLKAKRPGTFSISGEITDKPQGYFINQNSFEGSLQGKLTLKLGEKIKLAFGGLYSYSEWDQFYFPASKYGPGDNYYADEYFYLIAGSGDTTLVRYNYVDEPHTFRDQQGNIVDENGTIILLPDSLSWLNEVPSWVNSRDSIADTLNYNKVKDYYVGGMQDYLWDRIQENQMYYAIWTHSISSKSYYSLKLTQNMSHYIYGTPDVDDRDGDGDIKEFLNWDENDGEPLPIYRERELNYWWIRGDDPGFLDQKSFTTSFRGDLTSQINKNHLVKGGIDLNLHQMDVENISWTLGWGTMRKDIWSENSIDFGAFVQDKMEFEGLVALVGLRYDYFDPNGWGDPVYYPADYENPFTSMDADGKAVLIDPQKAPVTSQFSPRIGISHPITDRDVLYFTYGHYFQRPDGYYLYRNHYFQSLTKAGNYIGNPSLYPEKTVGYDVGLEHLFTDDLKGSITGYFKDVSNLMNFEKVVGRSIQNRELNIFTNADYGSIKGFELALKKRMSNFWAANFNYTFSIAKGRSSDPFGGSGTFTSAKRLNILDYDQTHTVNFSLTLQSPVPSGFLSQWLLNTQTKYGSGLPYTSYGSSVVNDSRMPATYYTDLRISKDFPLGAVNVNFFVDVFNLFDRQNLDYIGSSLFYKTLDDPSIVTAFDIDNALMQQYYRNPQVYSDERQFRAGLTFDF
jgi:outer membrane receptor protein involved in Fe transport